MIGPGTMSGDPDPGGGTEATTMDDFVVISVTNEAWLETCSDVHQISKQAALAARARQTFLVGPDIGEITVVLSDDEAMRRLSSVRLGRCLDIVKTPSLQVINRLFQEIQAGHLQDAAAKKLSPEESQAARAELVRKHIGHL